jgi:putative tryptophan/tyrosine transport system substrate-binding protein
MQIGQLNRREFITLLCGATAWPLAARAQQPAMPAVGFVGSTSPESLRDAVPAFHRGLTETGYIEGQNVAIEYRWAERVNTIDYRDLRPIWFTVRWL